MVTRTSEQCCQTSVSEDFSIEELARLRADTPSCEEVIHFDNAGASPLPLSVHQAVVSHLGKEQHWGGYAAKRLEEAALEGFYASIADLIGAKASEIAFAENASRAWNSIFYSISFQPGDRILVGNAEYSSSYLAMVHIARKIGLEVEIVPDGPDGAIDVQALANALDDRVRLVSLCHAPTSNGLVNDAVAVGRVLKDHPALYLLDACQSIGQIDIDVKEIGCDVLTSTGRKFLRGPRATGFLYVSSEVLDRIEPLFVDIAAVHWITQDEFRWRSDARRFETWERSVSSMLGLKAAAEYARAIGLDRIERRVTTLGHNLRDRLSHIAGIEICDKGRRKSGIVSFMLSGLDANSVRDSLQTQNMMTSAINLEDARLDLESNTTNSILRASIHYFNTSDEIERFAEKLDQMIVSMR